MNGRLDERPATPAAPPSDALVNQAIRAGILDAHLVLLGGYAFQGGHEPTPGAFEELARARSAEAPRSNASPRSDAVDAVWRRAAHRDGYDGLALLASDFALVRDELQALLEHLDDVAAAGPNRATVMVFLEALEAVELFVRCAYRSLGMELIENDPVMGRSLH